ncbi:MAG: hypothetical protein GYA24_10810, partial [Candidatus Lokiarchaeota archaeon]|nr:hypothetical protein [Candidatus Lokiarchaeota archaeon]
MNRKGEQALQEHCSARGLGFIMLFLIGMIGSVFFTERGEITNVFRFDRGQPRPADAHFPIFLGSNAALLGFPDKTGNGTESDPIIIKDLEIDGGDSGSCIELRNIDLFVIIKNCTVFNSGSLLANGDSGIELFNCKNVRIINCSIFSCMVGVWGIYSSRIAIESCNIHNKAFHGIRVRNTDVSAAN